MTIVKQFPELETDRLKLRELTMEDVDFVLAHFSDEDICRYLYDEEPFASKEEAVGLINWYINPEGKNHNRWGLVRKEDGVLIGTCGYHCWDKNNNIAEIGYDLNVHFWGQGYMTEAMTAAIQNGFENMGLNRIQAYVYIGNKKSIALLEKLGFKKEGIVRDKHLFRGQYYDHYCLSLLRREWRNE